MMQSQLRIPELIAPLVILDNIFSYFWNSENSQLKFLTYVPFALNAIIW